MVIHGESRLPVCCQPGGYVSSRDLCHDVAPEKRSVNQSHRLWIPVELGFLVENMDNKPSLKKKERKKKQRWLWGLLNGLCWRLLGLHSSNHWRNKGKTFIFWMDWSKPRPVYLRPATVYFDQMSLTWSSGSFSCPALPKEKEADVWNIAVRVGCTVRLFG